MNKIELRKFLKFYGSVMIALVFSFYVSPANAQFPYKETFKNNTAGDVLINGISNGATLTSGSIDPPGEGYLRLTNNQKDQSGYVQSTTSFPTANGLSISFEYFTYGGTGADGIAFFLYDATASPFNIGAFGGSLGYAQNASSPGVSKGFLALGLDEFGNFSNPTAGRIGGPGSVSSAVVLRGNGDGLGPGGSGGTNYKYLKGVSTNNPTEMAAAGGIFHVGGGVDPRPSGGINPLNAGYRKAKIDLIPNGAGTGFILNVWITEGNADGAIVHQVIKDYSYLPIGPIPANLSYGFSASTGGSTNYHEIRNLEIHKPIDPATLPVLANVNADGLENADLLFKASDFTSKFSHAQSNPLVKIKIQNLPKYGVLKLDGASLHIGQEINVNDISQLKFIPESDFSGTSGFQWNGSDGNNYAGSDAFVNIKITGFSPTFPYLESFMKSSASGLIKGGTPNPAELTSGTKDPIDAGYLRLTNSQTNQSAYVYSTKDFPADQGLSISFDYFMHGGTGSDGISFFLYDAAANPFSIGAFGGSLGYTQSHSSGGISKAFIGLGIDEFGNFSNTGTGRQGGPGKFPASVTLRGDGDGNVAIPSNYEYLTHTQTNNAADMLAIGPDARGAFQLSGNTNGRDAGDPLKTGYRRLKMELVPNGAGFLINVWITEGNPAGAIVHQVIKDYPYLPTAGIPAKLRYGFSAGNGAAPTIYEIRNLEILLPSNSNHKPELRGIEIPGYEDQELVFTLKDFESRFYDPTGTKTLKNIEFTSLPLPAEGFLQLNSLDVKTGDLVSVSDINSGKLRFFPATDLNGKLASFKWNGHNSTAKADLDENVSITLNPVNDSPLSENVEISMGTKEHVLTASNFKFTDPKDNNLHALKAVKMTTIPSQGTLKLDKSIIAAGQLIDIEAIRSGQLTFTPDLNGAGKPYASFTFQVQDNGGKDNGGDDLSQIAYVFKINVVSTPVIELEKTNLTVCVGSSSAAFMYTSLSGDPSPDSYSLDWDAAANEAGLIDINDKDLLPGAITVENLSNLTAGIVYNGFLTVKNKNSDIRSIAKPISMIIKPLLKADIAYGSGVFCASGKTMVTFSGDIGGKFNSSAGLIIDELTGEVNLKESIPGNYTVSYSLNNDACILTATTPITINAIPVISAITGSASVAVGSTSQLTSATAGGSWRSSNMEVLSVNSKGLVRGLRKGEAQVFYTLKTESCIDSVSFMLNVTQAETSDLSKITNENKSIVFSSSEFYSLIDSVLRANDPSKSVMASIRIESLPSDGELKLNGIPVGLAQNILFSHISALTYTPAQDFNGTVNFKWNWADVSGKYGMLAANVNIAVTANATFILKTVNENEVFTGKTGTSGRKNFTISGTDADFLEINGSNGEFIMKARDFESPEDADADNIYEFAIQSVDNNGNTYTENWKIAVQNVQEIQTLSLKKVEDVLLNKNSKYISVPPVLNGNPVGKITYTLIGKDSGLFMLDQLTGIISLEGRDFKLPSASDRDNVYEIGWRVTDSDLNTATMNWSVRIIDAEEIPSSGDNRLSDLKLSKGILSPQFKSDIFNYDATVGNITEEVLISAIPNDENAEIKINGIVNTIKESQVKIPLKPGENIVSIVITANAGLSKQTYTININRIISSLPYKDSFSDSTSDGLVFGGFPDQAKLTSGSIDASGRGYLRLTSDKLNESGFVYNSQKFSSEKGLSISFEYYSHGGTGGNGLSFYLFDASADFSIGAYGGSLGYAQSATGAGLSKGFIGLGLDEFGEFSSTASNKQGGPGRRPSSVVLRGDGRIGDLGANYKYLSGLQTTDAAVMKVAGAGNKFSVFSNRDGRTFDAELKSPDIEGYRKVKMELAPMANKPGFIINVWITEGTKSGGIVHHVINNYSYIPIAGIPMNLKYGFAASNGNFTNIYEVRNLEIDIPILTESPDLKPETGEGTIENPFENPIIPLATNVITPNGDGINDTWVIRNIEDFSNSTVRIFNRSGQEIYRTNNYNNDWDGSKDGNLIPRGTYYYIIETGNAKPSFKGHITVL